MEFKSGQTVVIKPVTIVSVQDHGASIVVELPNGDIIDFGKSDISHIQEPKFRADGVCVYGPDGMVAEFGFGKRDDDEMREMAKIAATALNNT